MTTQVRCPRTDSAPHFAHSWGDPEDASDDRWCPGDVTTSDLLDALGFDPNAGLAGLSRRKLLGRVAWYLLKQKTCRLRRHKIEEPVHIPGRGDWWACACGKRVGGRVY